MLLPGLDALFVVAAFLMTIQTPFNARSSDFNTFLTRVAEDLAVINKLIFGLRCDVFLDELSVVLHFQVIM